MDQHPARGVNKKRWLLAGVKLAIVVVVLVAVSHTMTGAFEQLGKYPWRFDWTWLAVAGGVYLLGLLPAGLFWYRVLWVLGQEARLGETLRAYYIGHLGKYVPGKAMVVVLRAGLIRSRRVDTGVAAVSVFFETLTMMTVGAFIAAAIIAGWYRDQTFLFWVALALMVGAGMPTLPPVFRRLVKIAGIGRSDPLIGEKVARLGYGTLLVGWASMGVAWLLLGASLWAVLRAMGVERIDLVSQMPLYVACVSLAMVAGFLSLIPGGALVREAILAQLLAPHFGEAVAIVSAILLRLVWLVAELAISCILYVGGVRRDHA